MIEAKVAGQEIVAPTAPENRGNVLDLMEALKASVKLAEENRQGAETKPAPQSKGRKKAKTGS